MSRRSKKKQLKPTRDLSQVEPQRVLPSLRMRRIEEALEFHNDEAGAPRTCRWCAGRKIGLDFFTAGAPFACSVGFHYCETCNAVLFVYPPLALMGEVSEHAWAQRVPVSQ